MIVKCLAQEHNTVAPVRARARTARSGNERTNHEATAPLPCRAKKLVKPVFIRTYCVNGVYKYENSSFDVSDVLLVLLVLQKK